MWSSIILRYKNNLTISLLIPQVLLYRLFLLPLCITLPKDPCDTFYPTKPLHPKPALSSSPFPWGNIRHAARFSRIFCGLQDRLFPSNANERWALFALCRLPIFFNSPNRLVPVSKSRKISIFQRSLISITVSSTSQCGNCFFMISSQKPPENGGGINQRQGL